MHLAIPGEGAALAFPAGEDVDVLLAPGAFVASGPGQSFFAGTLSAFDAAELLSLLNAGARTGVLTVRDAEARRAIYLRGGEVVFAASTGVGERLGEVLYFEDRLSRAQLDQVQPRIRPGVKLGQLLVQEGLLTSAELFSAVSLQIRAIVLALFDVREGLFLFDESEVEERTSVRLEESTRDLIVAGLHRGDEQARLWEQIGAEEAPLSRGAPPAGTLSRREAALLERLQDGDTPETLAARAPFGQLEAMRAVVSLLASGALVRPGGAPAQPAPRVERKFALSEAARYLDALDGIVPAAERPAQDIGLGLAPAEAQVIELRGPRGPGKAFEAYRRALQHVVARLREHDPRVVQGLSSFFTLPPRGIARIVAGLSLAEDGTIDVDKLLANAREIHGDAGRSRALEALESLLAFGLFEAKNVLAAAAADRLVKEVGRIQMGRDA